MGTHHEFSPSRLKRLSLCPGSYKLEMGLADEASEAAQEGTAMHAAVEHEKILDDFNEEQRDCIQKCLDYMQMLEPKVKWEKEVQITVLDGFETLTQGTMDAVCELEDRIIACDWKFGRTPVYVDDNLQVKAYSVGLMQKYGKPVEFHIAQPRLNYFKLINFAPDNIPQMITQIRDIVNTCKAEEIILRPSQEACRWCKAKSTCPATKQLIVKGELAKVEHCSELSTETLSKYLAEWRVVEKIGESLKNVARERLLAGSSIPDWELRNFQGKVAIKDPQAVFDVIKNVLSLDDFLSCTDVSTNKLLDVYARKRREAELRMGNKITLKQAKEELLEAIAPFSERGSDSKRLTFVGRDN